MKCPMRPEWGKPNDCMRNLYHYVSSTVRCATPRRRTYMTSQPSVDGFWASRPVSAGPTPIPEWLSDQYASMRQISTISAMNRPAISSSNEARKVFRTNVCSHPRRSVDKGLGRGTSCTSAGVIPCELSTCARSGALLPSPNGRLTAVYCETVGKYQGSSGTGSTPCLRRTWWIAPRTPTLRRSSARRAGAAKDAMTMED